jgi:hypothetical protein
MEVEVLLLINGVLLVVLLLVLVAVAFSKPASAKKVAEDIKKIKSQIAR